jgi:glycosyltransferase involved in cell wall biosynthesis
VTVPGHRPTTPSSARSGRPSRPELVSVIIPVRDGEATLGEELEALARQTYRGAWEVVIADNGSTDGTRAVADEWAIKLPSLRVVDASARPGSSHARNVGAAAARGSFLAFCDADDVVDEQWLAELVAAGLVHDLVGGVQEAARLNDQRVQSWRSPRKTQALVTALDFLAFAPTSTLGVWADVYETVGGLRSEYVQAHDVEFSWRAQLAGFDLGFAPQAIVHYRYRSTPRSIARQAYWSAYDAAQLYCDYRHDGVPPPNLRHSLRRLVWLVVRSPLLVDPARRGTWVRRGADAAGRVIGSLTFRVLYV